MTRLSEEAQTHLDKYLQQVRASLGGCKSVDAEEVERDVREHIDMELEGAEEPVSPDDLAAVLKRLGSPSQWVPQDELPWWRKLVMRLRSGPEDWRLAYIAFGLFILGLMLGGFVPILNVHWGVGIPMFPGFFSPGSLMLLGSFIVARAFIAEVEVKDISVGQKWLIYPSLVVVYFFILFIILIIPIQLVFSNIRVHAPRLAIFFARLGNNITVFVFEPGVWWSILGAVIYKWPGLVRAIFRPFTDGFKRHWAKRFMLLGLAMVLIALALYFFINAICA